MTGTFGNLAGGWVGGHAQTDMVTCTSVGCHNRTTVPNGPQGAAVPWYYNDGTAVTGTIGTHWYTTAHSGSSVPTTLGCSKCHSSLSGVHTEDSAHETQCQACHIRIPHAWKRPRLLRRTVGGVQGGQAADALPYADPNLGIDALTGYRVTAGQTDFSNENSCVENCGKHSSSTTGLWP